MFRYRNRKRTGRLEAAACGWYWRSKLSASSSICDAIPAETLGVAGGQKEERMARQLEKRPTMCLASMDLKTEKAFDVARPKHTHGWITTAFLHEITLLHGHATFEHGESKFQFARCIRQGSAMQFLWNVKKWTRRKMGVHIDTWQGGICSCVCADKYWIMSHSKTHLGQMMRAVHSHRKLVQSVFCLEN